MLSGFATRWTKRLKEELGYGGTVLDEKLEVTFGYKNNTGKNVAGVKGYISVKDLFGDELSGFLISNDYPLAAGETGTWSGSRSVKYSLGNNKDRKFADLESDKYTIEWEPRIIVFRDGSTLTVPK